MAMKIENKRTIETLRANEAKVVAWIMANRDFFFKMVIPLQNQCTDSNVLRLSYRLSL